MDSDDREGGIEMQDEQERRIARLLLTLDCDEDIAWDDKLTAFADQLALEDHDHPLARWILAMTSRLDWRDNVREFLGAYWELPRRPFLPSEPAAAIYTQAARHRLMEL